eukprot:CAMPEP_0201544840 /NCGR_PEP_ID=MMETSP0173_2-20130828/1461_1 /ASSEMBLY_ACC=CAM_ASM_000268 /TAXON_ID=218659 /ORGANISM="Vexillifera sp., Strain DIVA3 564/2" /LENGTH=248 /DNA_ID=CAMNT_0047953109 /DNA_START=33 /DNA_END=776 /DNA_ORIENTATION=-
MTSKKSQLQLHFDLQIEAFRKRWVPMHTKLNQMWVERKGMREAFIELWYEVFTDQQKDTLLETVKKHVEGNLPEPRTKSQTLIELSCPEFYTHKDQLKDATNTKANLIAVLDAISKGQVNADNYVYWGKAKENIQQFLKSVNCQVYPIFHGHPNNPKWTSGLLCEQRINWIVNFGLLVVGEFCGALSQIQKMQKSTDVSDDRQQASSSSSDRQQASSSSSDRQQVSSSSDRQQVSSSSSDRQQASSSS